MKGVYSFSLQVFSETGFILGRIRRVIIVNILTSTHKASHKIV